jgi:hypothetical protein
LMSYQPLCQLQPAKIAITRIIHSLHIHVLFPRIVKLY